MADQLDKINKEDSAFLSREFSFSSPGNPPETDPFKLIEAQQVQLAMLASQVAQLQKQLDSQAAEIIAGRQRNIGIRVENEQELIKKFVNFENQIQNTLGQSRANVERQLSSASEKQNNESA